MENSISAIIVAGGMGTRLGAPVPKAFIDLAGSPLFTYSLRIFSNNSQIKKIIVVVPKGYISETEEIIENERITKKIEVIEGGAQRWNSVKNGIDRCKDSHKVMIHDAARPFVNDKIINDLIALSKNHKSVITATPEVDTIRTFKDKICTGTVNRSTLIRVGTPQLFERENLLIAFENANNSDINPTDEAMLVESLGQKVAFAWGDPLNFKVTTKIDRLIAEALLNRRKNETA